MVRKQQGITLLSFVVVLVVAGFFALMAMKLFPMYNEFFSLKNVMEEFAKQPNSASMTTGQAQADLDRRFNISTGRTAAAAITGATIRRSISLATALPTPPTVPTTWSTGYCGPRRRRKS